MPLMMKRAFLYHWLGALGNGQSTLLCPSWMFARGCCTFWHPWLWAPCKSEYVKRLITAQSPSVTIQSSSTICPRYDLLDIICTATARGIGNGEPNDWRRQGVGPFAHGMDSHTRQTHIQSTGTLEELLYIVHRHADPLLDGESFVMTL
jgi:hypothetical protein